MSDTSTWLNNIVLPPPHPQLEGSVTADVVIVGGGLTGTLSAYLLGKAEKKSLFLRRKTFQRLQLHTRLLG